VHRYNDKNVIVQGATKRYHNENCDLPVTKFSTIICTVWLHLCIYYDILQLPIGKDIHSLRSTQKAKHHAKNWENVQYVHPPGKLVLQTYLIANSLWAYCMLLISAYVFV